MTLVTAVVLEQLWHRIPGGTGRVTRQIVPPLVADKHIEVAGLAAWHRKERRHLAIEGLPTHYFWLHRRLLYESWLRFGNPTVESKVDDVDVVWALTMIPPPTKMPVVTTVHDLGFLDSPEYLTRRGRDFFPRAWHATKTRSRMIVCPSVVVADECVRHGAKADDVEVVSWGVAPPRCETNDDADAIRRSLDLPERFVLWVGTLEPRKNLTRLIEAMSQVDDAYLVAVGPQGWDIDAQDLFTPLEGRSTRLGWVDDDTLSGLYRAAELFVFPSLLEGFGLPVLEAMAHGTPVVTSASTATEEAAGGAAVVVDPTRVPELADAIRQAYSNAELKKTLRVNGLKRAQELSWATSAAEYAKLFAAAA